MSVKIKNTEWQVKDSSESDGYYINHPATDADVVNFTSPTGMVATNVQDAIEEVNTNGDKKSKYNLGAYDTYVDNGDGTTTITRQTGYITINAENITSVGTGAGNNVKYGATNIKVANADSSATGAIIGKASNGYNVAYINEYWVGDLTIAIYNNAYIVVANNSLSTIEQFRTLCPITIQYKLASSYTEKVISNIRNNVYDDFLKDEYDKTLNLFDLYSKNCSITSTGVMQPDSEYAVSKLISVSPNTQYTISGTTDKDWHFFYYDSSKTFLSYITTHTQGNATITTPNNCYYMYAQCGNNFSNVMLNEGSTALTYQAYNGAIVHQKDIEKVLLWQNATPSSTFDNGYVSLSQNTNNFNTIMVAYKRLAPSNDVSYFLAKATQSDQFEIITSWNNNGTMVVCSRGFYPSGTSCYIYNSVCQHNNSAYESAKAFVIPLAIYGIKY